MSMNADCMPGSTRTDPAQVDVADEPARDRALDVQLLHDALLEHRDARLLRRHVDQDFIGHGRESGDAMRTGGASVHRNSDVSVPPYSTARPIRASSAAVSASGSPITPE